MKLRIGRLLFSELHRQFGGKLKCFVSGGAPLDPHVEDDNEGEILVKGPNVMRGYYKKPKDTEEVLKDGWFYTGDIGYIDDDGFLYITGRVKNMIVLGGGKKVYPEEVEEVISKSPLIKEMCVIARKATSGLKAGTEEVFAVIVPNEDAFTEEEKQNKELIKSKIATEINKLSEHLADYKRISDFMLYFDELPKTSNKESKAKRSYGENSFYFKRR